MKLFFRHSTVSEIWSAAACRRFRLQESGICQSGGKPPHSKFDRRLRSLLLFTAVVSPLLGAADLPALWADREKSTVAVVYDTESEIDRRPTVSMGKVIDDHCTLILPSSASDAGAPA